MIPLLDPAFSNGEITPALFGRIDIEKFHTAAATLRNAFVNFRGGAYSRAGFAYTLMSKQSWIDSVTPPRLYTFNFSLNQQFCLEFGDFYMRIYETGNPVVEAPQTIVSAANSNSCQIGINQPASFFAVGDWILINGCQGMTDLNGNVYVIRSLNNATGVIILQDFDGNNINATAFGAYVPGTGHAQRIYTVQTPYLASDIWASKFVQSANVLTIVNPNFPPYNLSRFGPLNWQFVLDVRGPQIAAPAGATAKATVTAAADSSFTPPPNAAAYAYQITAVSKKTGEESRPSNIANVLDSVDMASTSGSIIVNWHPVAGAAFYNVYRAPTSYNTNPANSQVASPVPIGSLFGLIAQSIGTQLVDANLTIDEAQSPPQAQDPLAPGQVIDLQPVTAGAGYTFATVTMNTATGSGFLAAGVIVGGAVVAYIILNPGQMYAVTDTVTIAGDGAGATATPTIGPETGTYPSVVSYFQQRRVYADSPNQPDTFWMSDTGAYDNFDASIPVGASDAITATVSGETVDGIQWMLEMPLGLVTFTGAQVLQIAGAGTSIFSPAAITPSNIYVVPQSTVGSSKTLAPVRIDWNILHYEPDNGILRELQYQIYFNIYISRDISWQSSHLLFLHQIVDRAWTRKPNYLLWHVRDDGILLSTAYVKDQEVVGWSRHTTQGQFRSVAAVYEAPIDALYAVVERLVPQGGARWFIERMDDRFWTSAENPWCIDCGVGTTLPDRGGALFADVATGRALFSSAGAVFTADDLGATIRMGGGIAVVTDYDSPSRVFGTWVYPCQEIIPDSPGDQPAVQTSWTIKQPLTAISGLPPYSAGQVLVGLADGIPIGAGSPTGRIEIDPAGGSPAVAGQATLPFPASDIKLGFGFGVQVQSVYLDAGNPTVQGRVKAIDAVTVRCENSAPMMAGANEPDASVQNPPPFVAKWTNLSPVPSAPGQLPAPYVSPGTYLLPAGRQQMVQPPFTGDVRINIPSSWQKRGQVAAQQSLPQPLNVLAFVLEMDEGDTPEQTYSQRPPRQPPELAGAMARWGPATQVGRR